MREDGRAVYVLGRAESDFEHLQKSLVGEIEQKISGEVAAARAISVRTLPREEAFQIPESVRAKVTLLALAVSQVRVVEVDGLHLGPVRAHTWSTRAKSGTCRSSTTRAAPGSTSVLG